MDENTNMDRREFSLAALATLLTGVAITISACGDDNPTSPGNGGGGGGGGSTVTDEVGSISSNHGHAITLSAADVTAAAALSGKTIMGTASHDHLISLSAAEMASIKAGTRVTVASTVGSGHSHDVTFN